VLSQPERRILRLNGDEIEKVCNQADLFLNVSGCCLLRERYQGCRRKVYIDTDPLYTQYKLEAVRNGTATSDEAYSVESINKHDSFFTLGENVGDPSCRIPCCGLTWHKTRQPIVLEDWRYTFIPTARAFTTVMSWKKRRHTTVNRRQDLWREKCRIHEIHETAVPYFGANGNCLSRPAPLAELREQGWEVVDGYEKSFTMDAYRNHLGNSRGEWSIAKNVYVASRSGWFSTRSAAYLALGKPVVVQDTGFSPYYPVGEGLFAFTTLDDAVSAIDSIEGNYKLHCEAARAIAEQRFNSETVLTRLLEDAGM
jgi:hypothetical protein